MRSLTGRHQTPEHREKLRQVNLGRKDSPETLERKRQASALRWAKPEEREKLRRANLGKHLSAEHRQKIGLASLGHTVSPEAREKARQANIGNKHCLGKRNTLGFHPSLESREKMRQARLRHVLPQKNTLIERLLRDEFKKRRLKFEMHKTMFGRFQPDFVFESVRLIVQADGDYWHSLEHGKRRDATFNEMAVAQGWSVWRFGEKEIKMHSVACARAVARFIHSRQPKRTRSP